MVMYESAASGGTSGHVFTKETMIRGRPATVDCVELGGQVFAISRGPLTTVALEDEWYEDIADPHAVIDELRTRPGLKPDLFTFWQRMPNVDRMYSFHLEWQDLAVLPVSTYENWLKTQIKSRVRNLIRKAEKEGVTVKEASFDDDFVTGMTAIFNEAPVRQGRPFWHYGKDFATVKRQFSRFLFRERLIGAYYKGNMIGFMMLADAGRFALTGQIISSLRHRDRSPNNALIAMAVQVCEAQNFPHLIYLFWSDDSLAEFKRRCGFERISVPRYYVPLSWKGEIALKLGAHRGLRAMIPDEIRKSVKRLRGVWYGLRSE